jgi:hypothetical protein
MGRSGLRWLEDVDNDLPEMKNKRWRQKAVDSAEWASIIKDAKAVSGPYSQGVSFNLGSRWVVSATSRLFCLHEKDPVHILEKAGWATGPVCTRVVHGRQRNK